MSYKDYQTPEDINKTTGLDMANHCVWFAI